MSGGKRLAHVAALEVRVQRGAVLRHRVRQLCGSFTSPERHQRAQWVAVVLDVAVLDGQLPAHRLLAAATTTMALAWPSEQGCTFSRKCSTTTATFWLML